MQSDDYSLSRAAINFLEVDRELARLARLCRVSLLAPGVAERVLRRDASICGAENPIAFGKLQGLLALHFVLQAKLAAGWRPA